MSRTSASDRLRARAAAIPANPPPTITIRFLVAPGALVVGASSVCVGDSCKIPLELIGATLDHLVDWRAAIDRVPRERDHHAREWRLLLPRDDRAVSRRTSCCAHRCETWRLGPHEEREASCDLLGGNRSRRCLCRAFILAAQLEQPQQDLVALGLELRDGARSDLGVDAIDERLLHLRRQRR